MKLQAYRGHNQDGEPVVIECWQLTDQEVVAMIQNGKIYVWVYGNGVPGTSGRMGRRERSVLDRVVFTPRTSGDPLLRFLNTRHRRNQHVTREKE